MANAVITKKDTISRITQSSRKLHQLGIVEIGLFGSFSHDQATEQSDVDLLVQFEKGMKTFDNFISACFLLEEALGRKVELVTKESLSQYLKPYIMKEVEYVPLSN